MAEVIVYDEKALIARLERLPPSHRVAFAAACAERLLVPYRRFSELTGRGDSDALSRVFAHSLIQTELARQRRDLDELGTPTPLRELSERLRRRAEQEARSS